MSEISPADATIDSVRIVRAFKDNDQKTGFALLQRYGVEEGDNAKLVGALLGGILAFAGRVAAAEESTVDEVLTNVIFDAMILDDES